MAAGHEPFVGEMAAPVQHRTSRRRSILRRWWPRARFLLALGVVAVVVWVLASHTDELSGLSAAFRNLNWWWIPVAVVAEAASFVCFAGMQYELLKSGGLEPPKWPLLKTAVASQAIANSLPGGSAVAAVYGFRWYRRFGADTTLAAWAMVGTLIGAFVSLSLVATIGLALATGEGASLDLIPVIIGAFLLTVVIGALFVYERPLVVVLTWALRASRSILKRPKGDAELAIQPIMQWVMSVRLGWRQIIKIVLWGTANWLFDCTCFAVMFMAVGSTIPWKGLLLAYGAGQLAAALPITPGGLGAVEGSITIALVAFGGPRVTTVDAVLLYRIISFWLVLLVGWGAWGDLALEVRKGRWNRQALASPIDVGPLPGKPGAVPDVSVERSTVARP
jgi:putative heme transporter